MCPDHQILSVYFDNELDSPWKEKLEAHLAGCAECRSRLEVYGQTRESLARPTGAVMEMARARVWEKLEPITETRRRPRSRPELVRGFWGGSFRVPVPVAAAAGLVLVLAFAMLLAIRPQNTSMPQIAGVGTDIQASPVSADMESILKYLDGENSAEMVIIRLPEATFKSDGEPKMIRAADYKGDEIRR